MNIDSIFKTYHCEIGVIFRLFESIAFSTAFFVFVVWFFGKFVVSKYPFTEVDESAEEDIKIADLKKVSSNLKLSSRTHSLLQLHSTSRNPESLDHHIDLSFGKLHSHSPLGLSNVSAAEEGSESFAEDDASYDYEETVDDEDDEDDDGSGTFLDPTTFYKNLNSSSQYLRRDSYSQC
ncbi:hypothetical protein CLIB1423_02S06634 [[Candida] railenensis]|uniref:Uncharacterized protein n=1 Tax=[Candida] railenensis TaxID=45579 RepID=A0A9P0VWE1_9ASCO|nr:hypothetical protein CLIB1423_02S06634 [[Candida] railenensis]